MTASGSTPKRFKGDTNEILAVSNYQGWCWYGGLYFNIELFTGVEIEDRSYGEMSLEWDGVLW